MSLASSCKLELTRFLILLKIQPHGKSVNQEGGHRTYFLNRVPIGGGTPHILSEQGANGGDTTHQNRLPVVIESVRKRWAAGGWVGGLVGGWVVSSEKCHFVAPSCKLLLARFSHLMRIQDEKKISLKKCFIHKAS